MGNPFQGHTHYVNSVVFSPDGRHIVSGSDDHTIRVWNIQTGDQLGSPFQGHTGCVNSVTFSPDGRHIVSGSDDQTIQVWDSKLDSNGQVGDGTSEQPTKILPISFSSSDAHTLQHAQNLFLDLSSDIMRDCRDLVHFQNDGWIVGPNGKLLLWVHSSYHSSFLYTPWTSLIIPKGFIELDLSQMHHGSTWHKCYSLASIAT